MAAILLEPLFAPAAATSAANTEATATHPPTSHHTYNPTGTYGPLTHALRTHQAHHSHPYTTPPQHTPPQQTPPSQPEFPPPPPPPPLPTADPVTPPPSTYKHSPQPAAAARPGTAPPPPPHVPSPTPPLQDSWSQTDHDWDANTLHGHQLYRTIQPTQWSRKAGVAGLPTFDIFPWQLAYHGTAEYTARTLSNGKYTGFIATRSVAEPFCVTHLLQELRVKRLQTRNRHPQQDNTGAGFPRPPDQPPHPTTTIPLTGTSRGHSSTSP